MANSNSLVDLQAGTVILEDGKRRIAILALLSVTIVWGATFVWMKQALDALESEKAQLGTNGVIATLVFARFAIAAMLMLTFFRKARTSLVSKQTWQDGLILGSLMFMVFLNMVLQNKSL